MAAKDGIPGRSALPENRPLDKLAFLRSDDVSRNRQPHAITPAAEQRTPRSSCSLAPAAFESAASERRPPDACGPALLRSRQLWRPRRTARAVSPLRSATTDALRSDYWSSAKPCNVLNARRRRSARRVRRSGGPLRAWWRWQAAWLRRAVSARHPCC